MSRLSKDFDTLDTQLAMTLQQACKLFELFIVCLIDYPVFVNIQQRNWNCWPCFLYFPSPRNYLCSAHCPLLYRRNLLQAQFCRDEEARLPHAFCTVCIVLGDSHWARYSSRVR